MAALSVAGLILMAGCDGDSPEDPVPTARVQVMLIDAPTCRIEELHLRFDRVELARRSAPVQTILEGRHLPESVDVIAAGENPVVLGTVDLPVGTYTWANLGIDPDAEVNRVVTADGAVHPLQYTAPRAENANLNRPFRVRAGEDMTLLFDFLAAASITETPEGCILRPRLVTHYVERGVQFGSVSGIIREVDGEPLRAPADQILGVFLLEEETDAVISLVEVNQDTGEFRIPAILPGRYDLAVQFATSDWERRGEPVFERTGFTVDPGQERNVELELDL
ncbi:MAG: DUF4382 domain-containing protein [Armatimonadota bacterium]